jgi:hypothetical protein
LNESLVDSFTEWARCVEPKLRHALTASFGFQLGKDAAADALAHAWVHWDFVRVTENRLGYVYGVGRNWRCHRLCRAAGMTTVLLRRRRRVLRRGVEPNDVRRRRRCRAVGILRPLA